MGHRVDTGISLIPQFLNNSKAINPLSDYHLHQTEADMVFKITEGVRIFKITEGHPNFKIIEAEQTTTGRGKMLIIDIHNRDPTIEGAGRTVVVGMIDQAAMVDLMDSKATIEGHIKITGRNRMTEIHRGVDTGGIINVV